MNDNLTVARTEYTRQLTESISPPIYKAMLTIFEKCKDKEDGVYKCFQKKLCDVPVWNQQIVSHEHTRIIKESKLEWLDILIEAIFICNIKILSSINSSPSTINIKIPDSKAFIHECYIQVARAYYMQPKLISQNSVKNIDLIKAAISKALLHAIPQKDVIESCLKQQLEALAAEKQTQNDESNGPEPDIELDTDDKKSVVSEQDLFMDPPTVETEIDMQDLDLDGSPDRHPDRPDQNSDSGSDQEDDLEPRGISSHRSRDRDESKPRALPEEESISVDVTPGESLERSLDDKKEKDSFFFSDSEDDEK